MFLVSRILILNIKIRYERSFIIDWSGSIKLGGVIPRKEQSIKL